MSRSLLDSSLNSPLSTLIFDSLVDFVAKFTTNLSIFDFLENSLDTSSTSIKRFISETFATTNEDKKKKKKKEREKEKRRENKE